MRILFPGDEMRAMIIVALALFLVASTLPKERVFTPVPFPSEVPPTVTQQRKEDVVRLIITSTNRSLDESISREMAKTYVLASERYDIDLFILLAKGWVESRFKPSATSYRNGSPLARGVSQFTMPTGAFVWRELGYSWEGASSLYKPSESIMAGAHYLAYLRDKYDGDMVLALTAYNMGPTRLNQYLSVGANLSFSYARQIIGWRDLNEL